MLYSIYLYNLTYRFHVALGQRVKAPFKIWAVLFCITTPSDGVRLVVLIHTASSEDGTMDLGLKAGICQVQRANDIGSYRLGLVVFTPVDIWSSSASGSIQNVCWPGKEEFRKHSLSIFHTDCCSVDFLALLLQKALQLTGNPTVASPYEEAWLLLLDIVVCFPIRHCHECIWRELWMSLWLLAKYSNGR